MSITREISPNRSQWSNPLIDDTFNEKAIQRTRQSLEPIKVNHYHGVRCGSMIWIGGQCDLSTAGKIQNPGNLSAQIKNSMAYFERVLQDLDCNFDNLVTLLCFYVNDGSLDEAEFLQHLGACLPPTCRTTVNAIPVPCLAWHAGRNRRLCYAPGKRAGLQAHLQPRVVRRAFRGIIRIGLALRQNDFHIRTIAFG